MLPKVREREKAIYLRKKGFSYKDILNEISVSKSTLSSWLKDLPLTNDEKSYLRKRTGSNISRGRIKAATALRSRRIEREKILLLESRKEFERFIKDPLFHVGIALYWAEGAKRSTSSFGFSNSDTEMISLMLKWIEKFFDVPKEQIAATLYLHKPYAHENCEEFWSKNTDIPMKNFRKTVFKPTGLLVKKRPNYKGCLRIIVGKVKYFKKIIFWQKMLVEYYQDK